MREINNNKNNLITQTFCERLRNLRKSKRLTTTELGQALKVSQSAISRWENGEMQPTLENLYNIAVFFNVTPNYLFGYED